VSGGTKSADATDAQIAGGATSVTETITFPPGTFPSGDYTVRVVNRSNFSARANGVCDNYQVTPYTLTATLGSAPLTVAPSTGPHGELNFRNFDASFGDGFYRVTVP
jgi:hypothetical protein